MTIIAFMGMIALVLLSMLGASFLGKVGGVEGMPRLRESLLARHGVSVEDPESLRLRPLLVGEGAQTRRGILLRFRPIDDVARSPERTQRLMRSMAYQIYSQPKWCKRLDFVEVVAEAGEGETRRRFTKDEALTTIGGRRAEPSAVRSRRTELGKAEPRTNGSGE
jgi:hypothetical protein